MVPVKVKVEEPFAHVHGTTSLTVPSDRPMSGTLVPPISSVSSVSSAFAPEPSCVPPISIVSSGFAPDPSGTNWRLASISAPATQKLLHLHQSISTAAAEPFQAGRLSRARIEEVLSFALTYDIPLRLHEVRALSDDDLRGAIDEANRRVRNSRAIEDPATLDMFRELIRSGALVRASRRNLLAPLFTVLQDSKHRLIYDARVFNAALEDARFGMETVLDVPALAHGMRFVSKLDLASAYYQYPIEPQLSEYLQCTGPDGAVYEWTVLPMGLSHSPRVFCSITTAFIKKWRRMGVRCMAYVDDIIFFSETEEEHVRSATIIVGDLLRAGVRVSPPKSFIRPYHRIDLLGLSVDMDVQAFSVPPRKIIRIKEAAELFARRGSGTRAELLKLVGRLGFAALACPYINFFRTFLVHEAGAGSLVDIITLSPEARQEATFWSSSQATIALERLWPWARSASHRLFAAHSCPTVPPTFTMWGDASGSGAGFDSSVPNMSLPESELLPQYLQGHLVPSAYRELWVIVRLVELGRFARGTSVRIISDNQAAVFLASASSASVDAAALGQRLFQALLKADVTITYEWAPREQLEGVDERSRRDERDLSHAMLTERAYRVIWDWAFGPNKRPTLQLFASEGSRIPGIPACSRDPEPDAIGCPFIVDTTAFQRTWAFPPFALVRPLLRKLMTLWDNNVSGIICALLPVCPSVSAFISAMPKSWRTRPGPSFILTPPQYHTSVPVSQPLIVIASALNATMMTRTETTRVAEKWGVTAVQEDAQSARRVPVTQPMQTLHTALQSRARMPWREVRTDALDVPMPPGWVLVHSISADQEMTARLARAIVAKHGRPAHRTVQVGELVLWPSPDGYASRTVGLVTKERWFQKPSLASLKLAVQTFVSWAAQNHVLHVVAPRLGCGRDMLKWDEVKPMLQTELRGFDVLICVPPLS